MKKLAFILFAIFFTLRLYASESLDQRLENAIKFNPNGPNTIGYIRIEDRSQGISEATWIYVKKALEYYRKVKPIFIIVDLNTPGGEVFAAQKISNALKEIDIQDAIPCVAFINNWAISAGAMVAYSCRFIAVTKDASMGAAEPLLQDQTGETKTASEKVNSAIRSDFANRAKFFDRNPDIAEAMVDKDIILVLRKGKITRLDSESQMNLSGPDPDSVITPKGKLLTLTAEQMMQYGVADILLPPTKLPHITEQEQLSQTWPFHKMLLSKYPFFAKIPDATVDAYRMDWKTRFFAFLATPVVSSILVLGLMIGFYLEISHPGFGLPGIVALISLFLLALSNLSLEIANWLELILLLTGLAIILVDLFLLPTFGLLGFIGILLFGVGLIGMLIPGLSSVSFDFDSQTLNAAGIAVLERLAWLSGTLLLGFLIILFLARYVTPKAAAWSRLILTGAEQNGYIAGALPSELPAIGSEGSAFSTLRPTGKVMIQDKIYEAITDGEFIEKGSPIKVARLDGSNLVVTRI